MWNAVYSKQERAVRECEEEGTRNGICRQSVREVGALELRMSVML